MKTIGFTNIYYTLWEVHPSYEEPIFYRGMQVGSSTRQQVTYIQNLSKDLEAAKSKLNGEAFEIDLELRGQHNFIRTLRSDIKNREEYYEQDCFSFGMLEGSKFSEATDIWQLNRAMGDEKSDTRRGNAKNRLIQLGELVEFNGNWITPKEVESAKQQAYLDSLEKGHFFNNGEKIEIVLKRIGGFSFDGGFGRVYIETYVTPDNKMLKYMGSSPPEIPSEEYAGVRATIKHDSYKGVAETKLQRIKIL